MNTNAAPRTWISGLALIGVVSAGLIGWLATRRQTTDLDALRQEVLALQKTQQAAPSVVREVRTVVQETKSTRDDEQPVAADAKKDAAPEQELTPEEAQYRGEVIVAAQEKVLADSYDREAPDPEWSATATASLRAAFSGEGFEALTIESECRATMCRVNFSYTDPAGALQWRNFMQRAPWPGASNSNVNNETQTGSFYLAREGHPLPSVDLATLHF